MTGKNRKLTLADVYDRKNVELAVKESQKNKKKQYGVKLFNKHYEENVNKICEELKAQTYHTTPPKLEKRFCINKWRVLAKVKYYDNVVEHALMQIIGPVLERSFYYESGASIKNRGVDYIVRHIRKYIDLNCYKRIYVAEIDFIKCYHNVIRDKLYEKLCTEFNDDGIRYLIHDIIWALGNHNGLEESDGKRGVGLGLYPIQPFVNFHFNELDRCLAAIKGVKPFRYSDNILIIGFSPEDVQSGIDFVKRYSSEILDQPIHENIGIQEITDEHGILFIGRRFFKHHTKISNKTKKKFKRKHKQLVNNKDKWHRVMSSYKGMLQHINGLHLWQTVTNMNTFAQFNIGNTDKEISTHNGKRFFNVPTINCGYLTDKPIVVLDFEENCQTKNGDDRTFVLVDDNGKKYKFCTNNPEMKENLRKVRELDGFPFETIITVTTLNGGVRNYYFT